MTGTWKARRSPPLCQLPSRPLAQGAGDVPCAHGNADVGPRRRRADDALNQVRASHRARLPATHMMIIIINVIS
eukprot:scaffold139535_cov36-Tisochrysis_lutea.AAC.1